jgi:hypothetical protein
MLHNFNHISLGSLLNLVGIDVQVQIKMERTKVCFKCSGLIGNCNFMPYSVIFKMVLVRLFAEFVGIQSSEMCVLYTLRVDCILTQIAFLYPCPHMKLGDMMKVTWASL